MTFPIVLGALLALTVSGANTLTAPRATEIAVDVTDVVATAQRLPLEGDAAEEATGILLVAIGHHESRGFSLDVEDCRTVGLLGEVGLWQVMPGANWERHRRSEICSSRKLQAALALDVLVRARGVTKTIAGVLRAYTSGNPALDNLAARERETTFRRLARSAGIQLSGTVAAWAPVRHGGPTPVQYALGGMN